MEPDHSSITDVFAKIEERRIQLCKSFASMEPCPSPPSPPPIDEFACYEQTLGFMAKNLPKDRQRAIMHQVYTLMNENQPDSVSSYCNL